ncbi:hypothetical protein PHMEG_00021115 [Phytophthora megakarya]|uniref:Peptidase A2 domain-containing protein n=1 Tax=Phytophthora megakarya TaxID=4795 RepID=A0A225VNY1_9STRA|nr:hypothetical protein PHMEG_00021115 [Phytophthora megakarya]
MTLIQDEIIYPEQLYPEYQRFNKPDSGSSPAEAPVEVALGPGQRYGWWEDHDSENSYEIANVCGAINDRRTRMLLDTGASVSIVSLDLARRLSLKIRTHRQIKVSGLGGIPTYISAHARVKITLGWEVVYIQDVWIGNISRVRQGRMRAERLEQMMRLRDPPAVPRPEYQWPTKLLVRPKSQDAEVKMVQLQE